MEGPLGRGASSCHAWQTYPSFLEGQPVFSRGAGEPGTPAWASCVPRGTRMAAMRLGAARNELESPGIPTPLVAEQWPGWQRRPPKAALVPLKPPRRRGGGSALRLCVPRAPHRFAAGEGGPGAGSSAPVSLTARAASPRRACGHVSGPGSP